MASALKADKLRVIGGLFSVWSILDAHSEDGTLEGYDSAALDAEIGWKGFAKAMQNVGWLTFENGAAIAPRYDEHNGTSAKRRALDTARKKAERSTEHPQAKARRLSAWKEEKKRTESGILSASEADKIGTREEKRREELTNTTAVIVSSIAPDNAGQSGDETNSQEPDALARIVAECRTAKVVDIEANTAIIERWIEQGASRSQVAKALADARKSIPLGELRIGYVNTILERVLDEERTARRAAQAKIDAAQAAIAESKAALAAKAAPPDGFMAKFVRHA